MVMDSIAASSDRVAIHQAIKHLVVSGNALIYMDQKNGLKLYPLNRYAVDRDGNGNIIEIVTKERISKKLLGGLAEATPNSPGDDRSDTDEDIDVFTHVRKDNNSGYGIKKHLIRSFLVV
jgi:hypothetical protein